jgi:CheY-like chemotaxis protein
MARILVVDDEPLIGAMTGEWLSDLGHVVVGPAYDLSTALKLAETDLDAAIVDVALGKDKSYPLADALSARGVPFALATGYGRDGIDPRYRAHSTLGKPFEFASFRRIIDELLAEGGRLEARGGAP